MTVTKIALVNNETTNLNQSLHCDYKWSVYKQAYVNIKIVAGSRFKKIVATLE